ncbi:MAG TPA: PLD nuclease N-terminal domain-containing protein [Acidimicrobiales bacterium]|nr:PLD nuclease N-terminal domain-containing protein [Acidimicrobiales bacterium]
MLLFDAGGIFFVALLGLWLYCLFDVIGTDESLCRNLPKMVWLLLVLFLPDAGALAWLIMGRPRNTTWEPGSSVYRAAPRGVDAEPEHLLRPTEGVSDVVSEREELARLRVREEQLRRREKELREREEEFRRRLEG